MGYRRGSNIKAVKLCANCNHAKPIIDGEKIKPINYVWCKHYGKQEIDFSCGKWQQIWKG